MVPFNLALLTVIASSERLKYLFIRLADAILSFFLNSSLESLYLLCPTALSNQPVLLQSLLMPYFPSPF